MKVTTITYQKVLNLGDYNSARLEKTALADEFEDHEEATQSLIESVERQIHEEQIHKRIDQEVRERKEKLAALKADYQVLKADYQLLQEKFEILQAQQTNSKEPEDPDIPFEAGDTYQDVRGVPEGF